MSEEKREAHRRAILEYWTPERMRNAIPESGISRGRSSQRNKQNEEQQQNKRVNGGSNADEQKPA